MASWMAHLRIADRLFDDIGDLPRTHFIVGNIAPDSGEPNEAWSSFTPSTEISHWYLEGATRSDSVEVFREKHLDEAKNLDELAFHTGYYAHLLTDYIWTRDVALPFKEKYAAEFERDPDFWWKVKHDMYDLDHLYLKEHPGFRAFTILANVTVFPNHYLAYFSETAFENRIAYITNFYRGFCGDLDREYPFINKAEMDSFVEKATEEIKVRVSAVLLNVEHHK